MKETHGRFVCTRAKGCDVELSIVIPCYNEEEALPLTIPPLLGMLDQASASYEVILVDNGSMDSTATVISSLVAQGHPVRRVEVAVNQGYGWGVICGLKAARGRHVGYMCADGQIAAKDVVRAFRAIQGAESRTLAKVKRIDRGDGWLRRGVSWCFNVAFRLMYGAITTDVNGTPKFFHRADLQLLNPLSKDNFIDAEIMIKAGAAHFRILEISAAFLRRGGGISKIGVLGTSLELMKHLISFRRDREFMAWVRRNRE